MFDAAHYEPTEPWRSPKMDRRARLHDRLKALGAFSAIAIGGVAGLEMVIGGGFDFINIGPEVREVAPSHYVSVFRAPWSSEAQVVTLSSTEPLFAGDFIDTASASDGLAGAYDDPSAPNATYREVSEAQVRSRIADLYANEAGPTYTDASITYDDAPASDDKKPEQPDPYAEAEAMVQQALGSISAEEAAFHPS